MPTAYPYKTFGFGCFELMDAIYASNDRDYITATLELGNGFAVFDSSTIIKISLVGINERCLPKMELSENLLKK